MFKVEVDSVQIANVGGKVKRFGRFTGRRRGWKKAYVCLKPGQEINFAAEKLSMPLQKVKPTSPGRRALVKVVHPHLHKGRPVDALDREPEARLGPQQQRPHHDAAQGRRPQAALPDRRLQAQQGRHRGEGRAARVRPEPQRAPRAAALRRRRAPLHHRAARRRRSARSCMSGAEAPIKPGNCLPLRNIPVGTTIHCIEMLPGKGAQIARSAGAAVQLLAREGDVRAAAPALRRDPQGARRLPRDDRRSRQRGAQPALDRQGRRQPLARHPPDGARHLR